MGRSISCDNSSGGGFTLGVRAPGQSYRQCLNANSSNYSLNTFAGTNNFLLSNDVGQLLFGDRAEGSAGRVAHSLSNETNLGGLPFAGFAKGGFFVFSLSRLLVFSPFHIASIFSSPSPVA